MAVSSTEGFFTSDGVLRTDNLKSTSSDSTKTSSTSQTAAELTTEETAAAITEAAIVSIASSMNVGSTGYDDGVAAMVQEAVLSALTYKTNSQLSTSTDDSDSSEESASTDPGGLEIGGTYQNEILASAGTSSSSESSESESSSSQAGKAYGKGGKYGGSYQNELIDASAKTQEKAAKTEPKATA